MRSELVSIILMVVSGGCLFVAAAGSDSNQSTAVRYPTKVIIDEVAWQSILESIQASGGSVFGGDPRLRVKVGSEVLVRFPVTNWLRLEEVEEIGEEHVQPATYYNGSFFLFTAHSGDDIPVPGSWILNKSSSFDVLEPQGRIDLEWWVRLPESGRYVFYLLGSVESDPPDVKDPIRIVEVHYFEAYPGLHGETVAIVTIALLILVLLLAWTRRRLRS
jgi:hypothetical protein